MEYKVDDQELDAAIFISFVNKVWPGDYNMDKSQTALSKTLNITAYDGDELVGCLRILSDGYYFGSHYWNCLCFPNMQRQGIGSRLLKLGSR